MWNPHILLITTVLVLRLPQPSVGEIQNSRYPYYYSYYYPNSDYRSYYTNPYVDYRYRYSSPVVRYTNPVVNYVEPSRSYEASKSYIPPQRNYNDDKVYITDKYGQTTVASGSQYRNYLASSSQNTNYIASGSQYRNYLARYSAMAPSTICTSTTCGSNAQCSMIGGRPVCSCFKGYMGDPLHNCVRAECLSNDDCRGHQQCKHEHCVDPCSEVCGLNANCEVRNHIPVCSCPAGYTGDPFSNCRRFDPSELCHPSPCGPNTNCEVNNGIPTCKCLPGYHGSPLAGCRHECETSSECGSHLACIEFKCQNPCHSQCGVNAECDGVRNNAAICKCPRGYFGNPYSSCQAECTTHSDCPRSKPACFANSCKNPCDGVCGVGANCELRDITPVCSCPRDMTGDPFVACRLFEKRDLCDPNPCGENAQCQPGYDKYNQDRPVCTCFPGYQGDPLRGCVRGECTEDSHCQDNQACNNYRCENPCIGQCGSNADCMARRHIAVCTCPGGYNGDALVNCYRVSGAAVSRRFYRQVLALEKMIEAEAAKDLETEEKAKKEKAKELEVKKVAEEKVKEPEVKKVAGEKVEEPEVKKVNELEVKKVDEEKVNELEVKKVAEEKVKKASGDEKKNLGKLVEEEVVAVVQETSKDQ